MSTSLVNVWTTASVPLTEVACLSAEDGFEVVLNSGRREASAAISTSLIGAVAGYPSARRAIGTIERWLRRDLSTNPGWQPSAGTVSRTLRWKAIGWCVLYALVVGVVAYFLSGLVPA